MNAGPILLELAARLDDVTPYLVGLLALAAAALVRAAAEALR